MARRKESPNRCRRSGSRRRTGVDRHRTAAADRGISTGPVRRQRLRQSRGSGRGGLRTVQDARLGHWRGETGPEEPQASQDPSSRRGARSDGWASAGRSRSGTPRSQEINRASFIGPRPA